MLTIIKVPHKEKEKKEIGLLIITKTKKKGVAATILFKVMGGTDRKEQKLMIPI